MKVSQQQAVFAAVRANIKIHVATNGEGDLVWIDDFTDEMFRKFYALYVREIKRLNN